MIDAKMYDLIMTLWKLGIRTHGCCEDIPKGRLGSCAWVGLHKHLDLIAFVDTLTRADYHMDFVVRSWKPTDKPLPPHIRFKRDQIHGVWFPARLIEDVTTLFKQMVDLRDTMPEIMGWVPFPLLRAPLEDKVETPKQEKRAGKCKTKKKRSTKVTKGGRT